jgi:hypothetical protein
MLQLNPDGNESVSVTPLAVFVPLFVTAAVKPTAVPADIGVASGVSVTARDEHCTLIVAEAVTTALLLALADAVFAYDPQRAVEVALVTCTVADAAPARLPKLQLSTCELMAHVPGPL